MEDEVEVGSEVYAIGHPVGLYWTFTRGVVSQVRKDFAWSDEQIQHRATVIQTQTPINPGNSGGPLFDAAGRVIGINSFIYLEAEGLNFAVAGSEIASFMENKPAPPSYEALAAYDLDGDGVVDTWAYDQDYDQVAEIWFYHVDGDRVQDITVHDEDGNGIPDLVYIYEDGKEFQGWDDDGDGEMDFFGWVVEDDENSWIEDCSES